MKRFLIAIFCFLLAGGNAWAEEKKTQINIPSIPENPAASVLNLDPSKITRPGTPATIAGSFLNAVDENGKFNPGVAIEFAPVWLAIGSNVTLEDWRGRKMKDGRPATSGYGNRLASWFSLSFMTAANEDGAVTLGGGLKLALLNDLDPRFDVQLSECMKKVYKEAKKKIRTREAARLRGGQEEEKGVYR